MRGRRKLGSRRGRGKTGTGLQRLLEALEPRLLMSQAATSPYAGFSNGPPTDPNFFPIGVWYQNLTTSIINGYAAMGVNVYDYPASGVTTSLLTTMKNDGMYAVIPYTSSLVSNKTVIGWFNNPDEPDNAQANGSGGYGDPVNPQVQIAQYNTLKTEDSTRPVLENLGQAVAWPDDKTNGTDSYYGRGSRTNHPEDYGYNSTYKWTNGVTYTGGYTAGSDIALFDFYPMNSTDAAVAGKIQQVGYGVTRLINWSAPGHPVWNWIETTDITVGDSAPGPTPAQVKAEVWLSLVHGSMGIMYFCHQFPEPPNSSHRLLDDPVMNPAVTAIDAQIKSLAPMLNSATVHSGTIATGTANNVHMDFMTKNYNGDGYIFAVADQASNGTARFYDPAMAGVSGTVQVIGENRTLPMYNGVFQDTFSASTVHLYKIVGVTGFSPTLSARVVAGDVNGDGVVNFADFAILSNNLGTSTGGGPGVGDLNGDGVVNAADFAILSGSYSTSSAAPASDPAAKASVATVTSAGTTAGRGHKARGHGHEWGASQVKLDAPGPDVMQLTILQNARGHR